MAYPGGIPIHIYDYMVARAASEGVAHEFTRQWYSRAVAAGVGRFFNVEVDCHGYILSDEENTAFFEEYTTMNAKEPGVSIDAMLDRRHLLEANLEEVMAVMRSSGVADPVGIVVDANDFQGRQVAIYCFRGPAVTPEEAERRVDEQVAGWRAKRMIPTLIMATTMEDARHVLPNTSPTAQNSMVSWEAQRRPGQYLVVAVASGGNTYATVEL